MSASGPVWRPAGHDAELGAISRFITAETHLLDERRFEEWMALFTDDGYYWAPTNPAQPDALTHVSLFFDDMPTMQTRIARLRHPKIHMQIPHSRTVHIVGNVQVESQNEAGVIFVKCNFIMLEYRPTRPQNVWGGRYDYQLMRGDLAGTYRIAAKKATLVNSDDQFPSLALWF
jgi:3-phenylpropionate/cinnamic acid dioxygenase small subunit